MVFLYGVQLHQKIKAFFLISICKVKMCTEPSVISYVTSELKPRAVLWVAGCIPSCTPALLALMWSSWPSLWTSPSSPWASPPRSPGGSSGSQRARCCCCCPGAPPGWGDAAPAPCMSSDPCSFLLVSEGWQGWNHPLAALSPDYCINLAAQQPQGHVYVSFVTNGMCMCQVKHSIRRNAKIKFVTLI